MKFKILFTFFVAMLCTGCARYYSTALYDLPSEPGNTPFHSQEGVIIAAKAFTHNDCRLHLDRDVLKKGYQPIQIYLQNNTNHNLAFSPKRIDLPLESPQKVAKVVRTSTIGRVAGYGAAALIASPLFAVPAVVDGYNSVQANKTLTHDFVLKGAKEQILAPHAHLNAILFVPKSEYREEFTITLIDTFTDHSVQILVKTQA